MTPFDLKSEHLNVRILPLGATLAAVRFAHKTQNPVTTPPVTTPLVTAPHNAKNLVLGFADPEDHLRIPAYAGAIVGPVASRVAKGLVCIEGAVHQMERNENGFTALHSGTSGIHTHLWKVHDQSDHHVTLITSLNDGDGGLPGNRRITARYTVTDRSIILDLTAQTDRATPMNLAAHAYWNLDGAPTIADHRLEVAARTYTPTDAHQIPTGELAPTKGTLFDFEHPTRVPLDPQLDVNLCLSRTQRPVPAFAAKLIGGNGTSLSIHTTALGLQIYNGAHLPAVASALTGGDDLRPFGGIALEPQYWPDAPNQPDFPQITLLPGTVWRQRTEYHLTSF